MTASIGFGGAFVRVDDPEALSRWSEQHLGFVRSNGALELPTVAQRAPALLALFARDDEYFPSTQPVMLNLQVDDLDAVLDRLVSEGVAVDPRREAHGFGRFGWITDPEGNRIELWQPTPDAS
jgi:predicted enzyme related to lactoylglutathione lyase